MRVLAQEHFLTDVLISGKSGWLIGRYVLKKHGGSSADARVCGRQSSCYRGLNTRTAKISETATGPLRRKP